MGVGSIPGQAVFFFSFFFFFFFCNSINFYFQAEFIDSRVLSTVFEFLEGHTTKLFTVPYFIDSSGYGNKPHKPVMTNIGLCFAWNQRRISDVFKTSNGLQSFERELIGNVTYKKPEKASIKNIEIFLDKDEMTYPNRIKSPKSFW